MSKGIPVIGRDPNGKAKIVNVDEHGNLKVAQYGTIVAHVLNNAQTVAPGANSTEVLASTYIDGTEKEVWLSVQSDQPWFFSRVPNLANRMAGYAKAVYPNNKENPPFFPATGATPVYHLGLGGFFDVVSWVEAKAVALPPKGGAISVRNQGEVNATMTVTLIRRW